MGNLPPPVDRRRTLFAFVGHDPPADSPAEFEARRRGLINVLPVSAPLKGEIWSLGARAYTLCDNLMPPNVPSCNNAPGARRVFGATTATSLHPGGVHCLLADGHVHYVKDQVAPEL